ncbi:hypothetical protein F7R91_19990 [Streptomyces luteolifulvus]|uniref:Uncharacterized protein n=1 Tax=Streptomyces luteolifulvus TaxID=2615112 RepID=A0A6H9V0X7_9ACTN|nr:hypothetical protein [Streptomyces luteolifulvus]KAB1144960.1 hypothetical protein F7R91_19990 [Streptomyces luteolifulvus]
MPNDRHRQYIRKVRADVGMEPAWPPSADRRLGDVGVFRKGHFERKGTLKTLFGIDIENRPSKKNITVFHGDSKGSVQIHLNTGIGAGAALVTADGSMVLEFGRANSVLFHAAGCRTEEIRNIDLVEKRMKELHADKKWPRDHVVVTEVTHAERTTAIMCSRRNGRIALRAAADPAATGLDLLTATGGLQWTGGAAASLQVLSEGRLTPLYRARGMIRHWFREDEPGFLDDIDDEAEDGTEEWFVDYVSSEDFEADDYDEATDDEATDDDGD